VVLPLPFGLISVPAIFNAVAEALAYVISQKGVEELDHYLDGFSIVGPPKLQQCRHDLDTPLQEKTEGPSTKIILLGN